MASERVAHRGWEDNRVGFMCPGCQTVHEVTVTGEQAWGWNGSLDAPTFTPSILARGYSSRLGATFVCHSFVTDGRIQFLSDSSHTLAGQTVTIAPSLDPYNHDEAPEASDA